MAPARWRSPVVGVVTDRSHGPGESARFGDDAKPIVEPAHIHRPRVELELPNPDGAVTIGVARNSRAARAFRAQGGGCAGGACPCRPLR